MTVRDHVSGGSPGGTDLIAALPGITSVFQPLVDLGACPRGDGAARPDAVGDPVVGYEALARGPQGLAPAELFAAARRDGTLAALDEACRVAAFTGAVEHGLHAPLALFVNVEPEVLDEAPLTHLARIAATAPDGLQVVLEITERALTARPAQLLRSVERVRDLGWRVALDDVGVDVLSLAFMPLLRPEVVKLDARLVQSAAGPRTAEVVHAVNAYAERSGALVVAEGIETHVHRQRALALGARWGQGWLFGRPSADPVVPPAHSGVALPLPATADGLARSPFAALPPRTALRRAGRSLLLQLSRRLEDEALRLGENCVVASTFQDGRFFAGTTATRYAELAGRAGFVAALGVGMPAEPVAGVRGAALDVDDPLRAEWDVVVLGPHFAGALLARETGHAADDPFVTDAPTGGPPGTEGSVVDDGGGRTFEFALTYDRDTVVHAARGLVARIAPRVAHPDPGPPARPAEQRIHRHGSGPPPTLLGPGNTELLVQAMSATASGITIADVRLPDAPLVFVNRAFEELSGFAAAEVLGRNCRFLQSPLTDPSAVARIREAIRTGREAHEIVLNVRGPSARPWWNEIRLAPVLQDGELTSYVGVQSDVTRQVETERELRRERDRARSYSELVERSARTDPLTGLVNRRTLESEIETHLQDLRSGSSLALLFCDLDDFKGVNDTLGHVAGDDLLREVGRRLEEELDEAGTVARFGGDEFVVVVPALDPADADRVAAQWALDLREAVREPLEVAGALLDVDVSIGASTAPEDGTDFRSLLHRADGRMYIEKARSRARRDPSP